jgi:ketosteroid isomerase-like protein
MKKMAIFVVIWLAVSPPMHSQEDARQALRSACMQACMRERPDADLQRQEVIVLEKEAARAVLLGDATFFRRVYSDDFSGVLSRGEVVDKASFIKAVQSPQIKYESFTASDVKVRVYRDLAVATSTWSMRAVLRGQPVTSQMRAVHVYMYTSSGYRVVTGQTTLLPPLIDQPL